MAGLRLDKDNTQGFTLLPEGEYEVYPVAFAKETAQSSGNKMAQFNYTVRDDVDQEGKGEMIRFDNFVETDGALWRINQASEAAGLDMDKEYPEGVWQWAEDFVNKAVRVVVGHRTYNGRTFPEVREFKPSLYGGTYTPPAKEAGGSAATATPTEPIDISDDDLPF